MTKILNYVVLLTVVALIVAASGCASNNPPTQTTPAETPAPVTPVETTIQVTPAETPIPVITPTEIQTNATENDTVSKEADENTQPMGESKEQNAISSTSTATTVETPLTVSTGNTTATQNVVNLGTAQRNLKIIQNRTGTTSNASSATISVIPSENAPYTPIVATKSSDNKNPFNTTINNMPVAQNTGNLKIVPASGTVANTTAVNIGSAQRNAAKIRAAQGGQQTTPANTTSDENTTVSISGY